MTRSRRTDVQVLCSHDGRTVWVNDATGAIGRFSKAFGMDVHRNPSEADGNGGTECLHCTHRPGTEVDWLDFIALMKRHHGVAIDASLLTFP